ncbi:integrase core domain-containing protein [Klebsiella sp. BIGb0407]|uniref:integrase core domain-containing protein n=1 Tax=Klebsiella sp. BIGb0407 TaxID=2940603 RepID=UPI0038F5D9B8
MILGATIPACLISIGQTGSDLYRKQYYIQPEKPKQNGFIKRFHGSFLPECSNSY